MKLKNTRTSVLKNMIRSVNKIGRAVLAQSISVHRVQSRPIMYGPLYKLAKKMLPKMSATERAALV